MLVAQDLYDKIPVYFCSKCLSLKILRLEGFDDPDACYCEECGNTQIRTASVEQWEELYKLRYKHPYITYKKDY